MQFSDTTNKLGIIEDITFLTGINTTDYATADRTRNVNERYRMVWSMIFESYGGWKFQDDNSNATPYGEQTLTSGTGVYALPTGSLTVRFVQVKDSTGTLQPPLIPLSEEEFKRMGGDSAFTTTGIPTWYMLYEDQVKLLPAPNYTVASTGLRVYFDADISTFAASDTTKTPGFASPFHRMLSIGAALDYAMARVQKEKVVYLTNLWNDYERRLRSFYSKRFQDRYPHQISHGSDLADEFR